MKHNAELVYDRLSRYGFTVNAISAIVANMEAESTINPGIWEGLFPYSGGYGLVQWTPYEKYADWAQYDWKDNGDKQCERINFEFEHHIQYYFTDEFPISAYMFKNSTDMPEFLASAWMHNYERPASYASENYRRERARYWFNYLSAIPAPEPEPAPEPSPEPAHKRGSTTWLFI